MKTKKIAKPEEWFKEFTPENVEVVLCGTSGNNNYTDSTESGGSGSNGTRPTSDENNESIYTNNFSYNPFE